jgi:hypothetical protein
MATTSTKSFLKRFAEVQSNLANKVKKTGDVKKTTSSSGKSFGGYNYFSNEDLLPAILEECKVNDLCTFFQIHPIEKIATLTIADTTSDDKLEFCSELFPFGNGSTGQCIAGGYTYIKRQLFISAFNIVENDNLEEQETKRMLEAEQERNEQAAQPAQPKSTPTPKPTPTPTLKVDNIGAIRPIIHDLLKKDTEWCNKILTAYQKTSFLDLDDNEISAVYTRAIQLNKLQS